MPRLIRYFWAGPNSAVALSITAALWLLSRMRRRSLIDPIQLKRHTGVLEVSGGPVAAVLRAMPTTGTWRRPAGAAAITIGHVVLAVDQAALDRTRVHERVHVRQYERWGPFFVPAYLAATLVARLRGRHAYTGNAFEREAYAVSHPGRFA
jgi:hypothetical protein